MSKTKNFIKLVWATVVMLGIFVAMIGVGVIIGAVANECQWYAVEDVNLVPKLDESDAKRFSKGWKWETNAYGDWRLSQTIDY